MTAQLLCSQYKKGTSQSFYGFFSSISLFSLKKITENYNGIAIFKQRSEYDQFLDLFVIFITGTCFRKLKSYNKNPKPATEQLHYF